MMSYTRLDVVHSEDKTTALGKKCKSASYDLSQGKDCHDAAYTLLQDLIKILLFTGSDTKKMLEPTEFVRRSKCGRLFSMIDGTTESNLSFEGICVHHITMDLTKDIFTIKIRSMNPVDSSKTIDSQTNISLDEMIAFAFKFETIFCSISTANNSIHK